jgi:aromatic ring hydroxylase
MGLRTPQQYIESVRDDRSVYYRGEKVADVTTHPVIKKAVHHAALDFEMAEMAQYQDLAVVKEGADEYSRYFKIPKSTDDLLKRSELIEAATALGKTVFFAVDKKRVLFFRLDTAVSLKTRV